MRRWWDKNRWQLIGTCLALVCAWIIRQTQGAAISELTNIVTRPFQDPTQIERLNNAQTIELQGRLVELERQNQQLRDLLDYRAAQKNRQMLVAPVIGRNADLWW